MYFIENFCKIKHPVAGILPFGLFDYQKKSLEDFKKYRFNVYRKTRQCFVKGSMVWTPNGPCPIEEIRKGDIVYTLKDNRLDVQKVSDVHNNGISTNLYEVRTKTGHRSICTGDHQFLTSKGWVKAIDLSLNDVLVEVSDICCYNNRMTSDAILLGYLITDGCYGRWINFTNKRWKYLLEFQKHFELKFGVRLKIRPHSSSFAPDSNNYRMQTNHSEARKWLRSLGIDKQTGKQKRIPAEVFSWNNDSVATLINRMFSGDGWYSGKDCNEAGIAQESVIILYQLKQLLSRFGINSKIYPGKGTISKLRIIGGRDFELFTKYIGIFGKKPRKEITKGFIFNRIKGQIKSVKPVDTESEVYDLTIPETHNYIVDGAVVHNCGISTLSGAYALWNGMFFSHKTILIVSKRDRDAKAFLDKNIKFVYDNLPKEFHQIYGDPPPTYNEHEIVFPNGSQISSLTSSKETLRSNSSSLNIIDEAGFMPHMDEMWAAGWPCVSDDSIISTNDGLIEIKEMLNDNTGIGEFGNLDIDLPTDSGDKQCSAIFNSGYTNTLHIETELGYEFEATPHHKLRIFNEQGEYVWKELRELKQDDYVCLLPNTCRGKPHVFVEPECDLINLGNLKNRDHTEVICHKCYKKFVLKVITLRKSKKEKYICPSCVHHKPQKLPDIMTVDLAEIIGYYIGDGSSSVSRPKRIKPHCCPTDKQLHEKLIIKLKNIGLNPKTEYACHTVDIKVYNAPFVDWMFRHGLIKEDVYHARIPKAILSSGPEIICAFLRGYFEADGSSSNKRITCSSVSKVLIDQVRSSLFSLGIITRTSEGRGGFTNSKKSYRLSTIDRRNYIRFINEIGFISDRKNVILDAPKQEHGLSIRHKAVEEFCRKSNKKSITRYYQRNNRIPYNRAIDLLCDDNKDTALGRILSNGLVPMKVKSIRESKAKTLDLSVPENNTYIANGFISHKTLQHGGSVIVISTCNGVGNWYEVTWSDAEKKRNDFNPIIVNWWDMDWSIEFEDQKTGQKRRICPTDGIRKCRTKEEKEKWGPYYSPWLEEQYRQLQQRGEAHLFRQEILAEFIGTGNTVLSRNQLLYLVDDLDNNGGRKYFVVGKVPYIHPTTSEELELDFDGKLKIWKRPIKPQPDLIEQGKIIRPGAPGHTYSMGVDISSGEDNDLSAIVVIDCNDCEQVAELNMQVQPYFLMCMMDYLARYFNNAFVVPERTGLGIPVCQQFYNNFGYSNVYHMKTAKGQRTAKVGFPTSPAHKPTLVKAILDNIGVEDGVRVYSAELVDQLHIFIHLGGNKIGHVPGPGNHSDIVMALGMSLVGLPEAVISDHASLIPVHNVPSLNNDVIDPPDAARQIGQLNDSGGIHALAPVILCPELSEHKTPEQEFNEYIMTLGGLPANSKLVDPRFMITQKIKTIRLDNGGPIMR